MSNELSTCPVHNRRIMKFFADIKGGEAHMTLLGILLFGFFLSIAKDIVGGSGIDYNTWNLFTIFFCTILCILCNPFPTTVIALISICIAIFCGSLTPGEAFSSHGSPIVWLVILSFFIARAFNVTGLGRRCCYILVSKFGGSSMGLAYTICFLEFCLSPVIPSNTARGAGVILPVILPLLSLEQAEPIHPADDADAAASAKGLSTPPRPPSMLPSPLAEVDMVRKLTASPLVVAQRSPKIGRSSSPLHSRSLLEDLPTLDSSEELPVPRLRASLHKTHPAQRESELETIAEDPSHSGVISSLPTGSTSSSLSDGSSSSSSSVAQGSAGEFLLLTAYHANCVTSAAFLTGCSSGAVCADIAFKVAGVQLGWMSWFVAALPVTFACLLVLPQVMARCLGHRNAINQQACTIAQQSLKELGPMTQGEIRLTFVFVLLLLFWGVGGALELVDATATALMGVSLLLLLGVINLQRDVLGEKAAFELLLWFPCLLSMANHLAKRGFFFSLGATFAELVNERLGVTNGLIGLLLVAAFFCASHYLFASLSAHTAALYATSLLAAIATGADARHAALLLAACSPLSGCLTHYSSGPAPLYFATGMVTIERWWMAGAVLMVVNLLIWWGLGASFLWPWGALAKMSATAAVAVGGGL